MYIFFSLFNHFSYQLYSEIYEPICINFERLCCISAINIKENTVEKKSQLNDI